MKKICLLALPFLLLILTAGCHDDGVSPTLETGLVGQVTDATGSPVANADIGLIFQADLPDVFAKPSAQISFQLPDSSQVQVLILDAAGNSVRTLVDDVLPGGSHALVWDATTDTGARVPNGLYWYAILVDGSEINRGPLLLIDPEPATLPERANTHTGPDGTFRIPREMIPTGVDAFPAVNDAGEIVAYSPISRTLTIEAGRMVDGNLDYTSRSITLPETWDRYKVNLALP